MRFVNKVVIVTGASSGIGAAIAEEFSKEGANVAIVGRNQANLDKMAGELEKSGKEYLVINADVSNDDDAKTIIDKTIEKFGKLDILINNAGYLRDGTLLDGTVLEAYDDQVRTNLRAVINLTTLAARHLIKTKGNIVNMSSVAGLTPPIAPKFLPYGMTKCALDHFTRGAALELGPFGVRVNSVNPGPVMTDFLKNARRDEIPSLEAQKAVTVLNRVSVPRDIAYLTLFLASDEAESITGAIHLCDNGRFLKT